MPRSAARAGSPFTGLGPVFMKELSDHLSSVRMLVLTLFVIVFGALPVGFALQDLRNVVVSDPYLFLRIFTVEEELPFAGHPVIGAATALHERLAGDSETVEWSFVISGRSVPVVSRRDPEYFAAAMDQGHPMIIATVDHLREQFAGALNLASEHLSPLPMQVISTGLPYLIVPATAAGLSRARIVAAINGKPRSRRGTYESPGSAISPPFHGQLPRDS